MKFENKKLSIIVRNDNPIIRDHRVHGIRILPGVTFVDMLYRILTQHFPAKHIELRNMTFKQPLSTSDSFDRQVYITLSTVMEKVLVNISSAKISGTDLLDDEIDEHVVCEVLLNDTAMSSPPAVNITELIDNAMTRHDMDEIYSHGRRVDIQHHEFMKTLGMAYQGRNYVLMSLNLSEVAQSYLDKFYLHPAFLDGATFSWIGERHGRYAFDAEPKPYIPLSIKRFQCFGSLPKKCYVYSELEEGELARPQSDLFYKDIKIYSEKGELLVVFEKMCAKRIRDKISIEKLLDSGLQKKEPMLIQQQSVPSLPLETPVSVGSTVASKVPTVTQTHARDTAVASLPPQPKTGANVASMTEQAESYLRSLLAEILGKTPQDVSLTVAFYDQGLDSIQLINTVDQLEALLEAELYPTLLFEYNNIVDLAKFLHEEYPSASYPAPSTPAPEIDASTTVAYSTAGPAAHSPMQVQAAEQQAQKPFEHEPAVPNPVAPNEVIANQVESSEQFDGGQFKDSDIAIIGVSGVYPESADAEAFWQNIVNANNTIAEIPAERWDVQPFFSTDTLKENSTYCKWGGFINDAECFDAEFFNISPAEAARMDPQLRVLLQQAWNTMEDAAYTPQLLEDEEVGVYVGVMNNDFTWQSAQHFTETGNYESFGSYAHDLANRVSYFMNFSGPSLAVESACSSSLSAIHLARQALLNGECKVAMAGGVNLSLHSSKYLMLSELGVISASGIEKSLDRSADGYVPAEGAGLVMLKPLKQAVADNDHIYAVIKGSAINHSGRGSGKFVPDVKRLEKAAEKAMTQAGIEPHLLSYIETHGSATALGDAIEIKALSNALNKTTDTNTQGVCALGTKANFGHLESASGICSLNKVLLAMQKQCIPPCANFEEVNPAIPLADSPFYIPTSVRPWEGIQGRRVAGINSMGVGGANAFLVVEGMPERQAVNDNSNVGEQLIVLSAKTSLALQQRVSQLVHYLDERKKSNLGLPPLIGISHSLGVGRTAMDIRIAITTKNTEQLLTQLKTYQNQADDLSSIGIYTQLSQFNNAANDALDKTSRAALIAWFDKGEFIGLYSEADAASRLSLPGYPFARQRYALGQKKCTHGEHFEEIDDDEQLPVLLSANNTGTSILKKQEAIVKTSRANVDISLPAQQKPTLTYLSPCWQEQAIEVKENPVIVKRALIFDGDETLQQAMQAQPTAENIVRVSPGQGFVKISDTHFEMNITDAQDYLRLIEALANIDCLPQQIVVNWCHGISSNRHGIDDHLAKTVYAVMFLYQALVKQRSNEKITLQYIVQNTEQASQPYYTALTGLFATLLKENPRIDCQLLVIEDASSIDSGKLCQRLLNEREKVAEKPLCLRYVDGQRMVKKWILHDNNTQKNVSTKNEIDAPPVTGENAKTIIISGGSGKLGMIFGKHFAQSKYNNVVLFGRSVLNKEKLAQQGLLLDNVNYYAVDITDKDKLMSTLDKVRKRHGTINGVLHCAGVIKDGLSISKDKASIQRVLSPKIRGTVFLDQATASDALDFFTMFSSTASVFGNIGQTDYAYANAFIDSYSQMRQSLVDVGARSGTTHAINWPLWEEGGMSVDTTTIERIKKQIGLLPMDTVSGIAALQYCQQFDSAQVVVLPGDRKKLSEQFLIADPEFQSIEKALLKQELQDYFQNKLSTVLSVPVDQLAPDTDFQHFGVDSLIATRMLRSIHSDIPTLPRNIFFLCANTNELSDYVIDHDLANFIVSKKPAEDELNINEAASEERFSEVFVRQFAAGVAEFEQQANVIDAANPGMENSEFLCSDNFLSLFEQGKIAACDSACLACYPHDMLKEIGIDDDSLIKALHGNENSSLFLRVYHTHIGRIAQLVLPIAQENVIDETEQRKEMFVKAFEMAKKLGAKTVSLQQTLPSVTNYGKDVVSYLQGRDELPKVSTGHSVTISAVVMMIARITKDAERDLENETVGFLGLGSIGSSTLDLMLATLPHPQKIVLCDIYLKEEYLSQIKERMFREHKYQGQIEIVLSRKGVADSFYQSSLIIGATNVPDVLEVKRLRPGTLIVDDSAPHCFDPVEAFKRFEQKADILFTEGGLLKSPNDIKHLRYAPDLPAILPGKANAEDSKYFRAYSYEQNPYEILGCACAGLLNTRFVEDIPPTLGIVDIQTSVSAFTKLRELNFEGADLRCRGRLLDKALLAKFKQNFNGEHYVCDVEEDAELISV